MPKKYENIKEYSTSWYALSANRLLVTSGPVKGEVNCDVCVIGGGFTGTSAALELAQRGFSVVLLEARELTSSAPGRNGGPLLRGFSLNPEEMVRKFGSADARMMCNTTLEGLALIIERCAKHEIRCDLKFGHLTAALNARHLKDLGAHKTAWDALGHTDMQMMKKSPVQDIVRSERYAGGLFDPKGACFHPLNYALGVAQGAQKHGLKIHDETPADEIILSPAPKVITPGGVVKAKFVIIAGAVRSKGAATVRRHSIRGTAWMISTETLSEKIASRIFPATPAAVSEASAEPAYYHLTPERRLLFGSSRNGRAGTDGDDALRRRMVETFPELHAARIDHGWHTPLDITFNRLPHVGRLSPNVYYAHGFGGHGHGIITAGIMGKLLADAVTGTAERFDVFAKIGHAPLGPLRHPLAMAGALWRRVRDAV